MTTLSRPMGCAQTSTYYEKDNYYMKDSQVTRWYGSLAEEFGLDKEKSIDGKDFYAILNGLDPNKITNDDVKEFKKLDKEKEDLEKKINKWKKSNNIKDFDKKNNPFKEEIDAFNIKKISLEKEINKRNGLEKLEVGSKVTVSDRDNIGTIKEFKNEKVTVRFLNSKTGKEITKTFDKNLISLAENKSDIKLFKDTKNKFGLITKERSGFDVTNSAPKSISILALTQGKDELLEAHRKANTEVLKYIENELVQYRKNKNDEGKREKVDGENMIASSFEHYTSRAVSRDTPPDPHIHTHNFIANIVKGADGKYRSMEPPEIYKKQMALGQIYRNALAIEVQKLGYEIEWKKEKKGSYTFEIKGMEDAIEKFSKRTVAIKEHIAMLEAERGYKLSKEELEIAKNEIRAPKIQQNLDNLKMDWINVIQNSNLKMAKPILNEEKKLEQFNIELTKNEELKKITDNAYKIVEDKESVLSKTDILNEALKESKGRFSVDDILKAIDDNKDLIKINKHNYASNDLEAIEKNIISKYETSKGISEQIAKKEDIENFLNKFNTVTAEQMEKGEKGMKADQKEFIKEVLTNKDQITLIQGDAGTGKTHAIKELNNFIKENLKEEYQVIGIAPTSKAVGELQEKANIDGKTVAKFLMEDDLKTQYKFVENEVIKERKIGEFTESEVKKLNFSNKELKWLKKKESEFGLEMKSSLHFAKDSIKSALIKGTYHIPIVRWVNALSTDKTFRNEYIGREGAVYKQTDIKRTLWDKFVTKKMESTTFTTKVNRNTGEITKTLTKIDKEGNVTTVNLSNKDNSKFSIGYKSREDHEFTKVMKTESYVAKVKEKIEMEKKPRLIIVDESSMLSTKDMNNIISKLKTDDKLVFVGDKKQLKSVQQGSFFEHLQNVEKSLSGKVTEMNEKTRQKSELTKDVVKDVENSKTLDAIEKIQNKGNFFEINNSAHLKEKFANNVISDLKNGKDTLALVSTNAQKEELNHKIREGLIKNDIVKGDAKILESFVRIRNNDFDKKQIDNYEIGNTLKANKMLGEIKSGVDYKIVDIKKDDKKIIVELPNGNQKDLKIEQLLEMEQYKSKKIEVKEGDKIIFNRNQGDFRNGTVAKITKIEDEKITISVNNKEKEFNYKKDKHFEYGYATTLHKSQGMDGKEVHLLSDGLKNKNAFYVSVTRAVDNIKVYAKDKDELSRGVEREQIKENISSKKEEILNGINSLKTQNNEKQQQPVHHQSVQQQPVTKKDLQEKIEALKNNSNIEKNISVEKTSEKDISKEEKKQSIVSYAKTENLEKAIANLPKEKSNNIDLSKVSLSKDDGKNIKEIVTQLSKINSESLKIDNEKINVKEMNQQISRSR